MPFVILFKLNHSLNKFLQILKIDTKIGLQKWRTQIRSKSITSATTWYAVSLQKLLACYQKCLKQTWQLCIEII